MTGGIWPINIILIILNCWNWRCILMKITSVDIITMKRQDFSAQTPVVCRINTDEGIYGYGEAGVSIMDFSLGAIQLLKSFGKSIIGMDPLGIDVIWQKLYSTFWSQGSGGVIMAAISAIDVALWDIKGKFFKVPCYVLLGGKHREKLRSYASQLQNGWQYQEFMSAPGDVSFLSDACKAAVKEGYDCVKIDFINKYENGRPVEAEILKNWITPELMRLFVRRAEAAREAVGPNVEIIMENHCLTSANTAIQFGLAVQHLGFMMLEEPANPLNPFEYRRISEKLNIPLATGERSWLRWGFKPLFEAGLSVGQPDLGNCGGITEGRKIADLAAAYGATIQTHTCNTPLSVAAALHLEAAIPNFIIHEHHTVNTLPDVRATCVYDYQPVNGYFEVPNLPGIGNELTEKALAESSIITVK